MVGERDHALALHVAREAGSLLLAIREDVTDAARRGKLGDQGAQEFIAAALKAAVPNGAILSEEGVDSRVRLGADRVWIIDPLDGTREFSEGRDDWAVHIALVERGRPVAGAVALPARSLVLGSGPKPAPTRFEPPVRPRIVISRTRPPLEAADICDALAGQLMPMGSAGAKAMAVVLGEAEVYVHSGGQYEWDSCAPVAVAAAAGLHVSRLDGSLLRYNKPDPHTPDLLICRPEFAARTMAAAAGYRRGRLGAPEADPGPSP